MRIPKPQPPGIRWCFVPNGFPLRAHQCGSARRGSAKDHRSIGAGTHAAVHLHSAAPTTKHDSGLGGHPGARSTRLFARPRLLRRLDILQSIVGDQFGNDRHDHRRRRRHAAGVRLGLAPLENRAVRNPRADERRHAAVHRSPRIFILLSASWSATRGFSIARRSIARRSPRFRCNHGVSAGERSHDRRFDGLQCGERSERERSRRQVLTGCGKLSRAAAADPTPVHRPLTAESPQITRRS